eukprot:3000974-Rhodomonas_salina.1
MRPILPLDHRERVERAGRHAHHPERARRPPRLFGTEARDRTTHAWIAAGCRYRHRVQHADLGGGAPGAEIALPELPKGVAAPGVDSAGAAQRHAVLFAAGERHHADGVERRDEVVEFAREVVAQPQLPVQVLPERQHAAVLPEVDKRPADDLMHAERVAGRGREPHPRRPVRDAPEPATARSVFDAAAARVATARAVMPVVGPAAALVRADVLANVEINDDLGRSRVVDVDLELERRVDDDDLVRALVNHILGEARVRARDLRVRAAAV